jgi:UDP-glucose 4-epimerase
LKYEDRGVLVTGGLGFIGSNLALRLAEEGARVTVVDSAVAGCGANEFNLEPARGRIRLIVSDISEAEQWADAIAEADVIFNLAGEISHIRSICDPRRDLELNTVAQLRFLETVRRVKPGIRVVYAGTRQVYGIPEYLPVDENHPVNPVDFNGIHKFAATQYHLLMARNGELDAVVLRLTNVYGPRMALNVGGQGFLAAFLRRLLEGGNLEVFGDGRQLRDPLFVDDAVDAFLRLGRATELRSRAYNVGGTKAYSVLDIAEAMAAAAGGAAVRCRPFPPEHKAFDIGSFKADSRRIEQEHGWEARTCLEEGLARTFNYYRHTLEAYLPESKNLPAALA